MQPVRNLNELATALAARRRDLGLRQLELDYRIGWADGHTGKLEQPSKAWGRRARWSTLAEWLQGLDAAIVVVGNDDLAAVLNLLAERSGDAAPAGRITPRCGAVLHARPARCGAGAGIE